MERKRFRLVIIGGLALVVLVGAIFAVATLITTDTEPPPPVPSPSPSIEEREPPMDATTTGVPAEVDLIPSEGIRVTEPGTVIDGLLVRGEIVVSANDVTIRNTLVESDTRLYPIHITEGVTGTMIDHVEVDNQGSTGKGIHFSGGSGTVRYSNIHSAEDGIRIQANNVTIEFSYIHDLARTETSHNDAIQIRSGDNITIRGNNLQAFNPTSNDPMNAAIQIGSLVGDDQISNLLVVDNLMNGGNVTVNGGGRGEIESAVFRDNRFGRDFRYGVHGNLENSSWDTSNVWDDTGLPTE